MTDDAVAHRLAAMAEALNIAIAPDDLARWASSIRMLLTDLERLRDLPIDGREPAFVVQCTINSITSSNS
jgi:hypothetical protein